MSLLPTESLINIETADNQKAQYGFSQVLLFPPPSAQSPIRGVPLFPESGGPLPAHRTGSRCLKELSETAKYSRREKLS